jgi:hypothetical protein
MRAQETADAITYRGGWRVAADPQASTDQLAYSTAAGATATFTFTGSSVGWVAVRGPARGTAAVYLDGAFAGRINLFATVRQDRRVVFARGWASSGTHRIRIVNKASVGHPRVDVDAFVSLSPG